MNPEPPPIADPHSTAPRPRRKWRHVLVEAFFATSSVVLFLLGALFVLHWLGYLPAPFDFRLPWPFYIISIGFSWLMAFSAYAFWQENIRLRRKDTS